jgi:FkbM family methyltransferase
VTTKTRSSAARLVRIALGLTAIASLVALAAARLLTPKIAVARFGSICPSDAGDPFDTLLQCGKKLYSQYDEELIIRHFFRDRRSGVFVDVGAAHYKDNSTTYYLEHHLGWSGVAVDAVADYGPDYAAFRPATRFFSYLVSDHSGKTEPFYRLRTKSLMSTQSKDWADRFGRDDYETVELQTITLNDLLAKAGVTKIDFLSMDIETGEPAALAGFDIDRYHPELVCLEVTEGVRDRITAYFAAHVYERVDRYNAYDEVNWYFRPAVPGTR